MFKLQLILALGALAVSSFAQVGVDGTKGSEWNGITPTTVLYDASAGSGNFGSPSNKDNTVAYDIYVRADSHYVYGLLISKPAGAGHDAYDPALGFTNLYFDTDPFVHSGSDVGFELQNNRTFVPGGSGYFNNIPGLDLANHAGSSYSNGGDAAAVEFALPWTYFTSDPQGIGFSKISSANNFLRLNLSQSFGYSVAGGSSYYGRNRLGLLDYNAATPEPATVVLLASGALALLRRKRR